MLQVAIVGGGPLGLCLALMLQRAGVTSMVLDARSADTGHGDARVLALSHGTRQILERLGVWRAVDATPIHTIHVSQQGRFGRTQITAAESNVPSLGHVIPAGNLATALTNACTAAGITMRHAVEVRCVQAESGCVRLSCRTAQGEDILEAQLVARADGVIKDTHGVITRDYGQQAITAHVQASRPATGLAYERFTREGIAALLPLEDRYGLIWTLPAEEAPARAALDDATFLDVLAKTFAGRLEFVAAGARQCFPLGLSYRTSPIGARTVWLGNAAQTLHPVAGQGFNLALRDAAQLARLLASQPDDCGQASLLAQHARMRRSDRLATRTFSDALVRFFSLPDPLCAHLRGAGLLALDMVAPARHLLAHRMIYGVRA